MITTKFVLDGKTPKPASAEAWSLMLGDAAARTVGKDQIGESFVSTVFVGLDHQFGDGPPLLFETLVFDGPLADEMERYSTWDEAEAGHAAMVARVRAATS